jgi:hypothetical protein
MRPLKPPPAVELSYEESATGMYRQSACWLAAAATKESRALLPSEPTENSTGEGDGSNPAFILPSRQVAQHMLRNHPGFVATSMDAEMRGNDESFPYEALLNARKEPFPADETYVPCCLECGAVLQAGYKDTAVRVLAAAHRLSRTQKRRQARQERRLRDATKLNRKQQVQYANVWEYGRHQCRDASFPTKQRMELTCGSCGSNCTVPTGRDKMNRKDKGDSPVQHSAKDSKGTARPVPSSVHQKIAATTTEKKAVNKRKDDLEDFIALPKPKKGTVALPTERLTLNEPRRKKKKKDANPLMDFLSSLNA